ncbi:Fis family transcriptional regulator [Thiopseudomonas alkaliphila]|uniref:sigma-54-dependent transcriptional regulator n=1 Tax=Thiopseudomonas alkaliphila TaxID=1697053 RepID=UPI00069CE84E|nr:sigma-54 dependent transcriptional regulator [Thiopseudomonas alkaliphila]AKX54412.1 Fis family transcriptional regulator [Thiopseudomonas alkaliphila]
MQSILIVEDEAIIRRALKRLLERNHYSVLEAGTVAEAQALLNTQTVQLIITDLRLPGAPGTDLIEIAKDLPVLIMTSYASLRSAVDSMRQGAVDYIAKPFDHDDMLSTVARILQEANSPVKTQDRLTTSPETANSSLASKLNIIGSSAVMQALFNKIMKVAPTDSNVLILGESGTGKELVARAIHEHSKRTQGPLINVNCAAIPESLIESELFGHEKGAFTGANQARAGLIEAANGGTLFLDEIGELPLEAQARLLRAIQEGEVRRVGSVNSIKVDVRFMAATHRDLKSRAQAGSFREDLYYRLHVIALHIPALRERGSDVIELAEKLLQQQLAKTDAAALSFSPEALQLLQNYPWPGNVRELENAIERAVILCDEPQITPDLLGIEWSPPAKAGNLEASATPESPSSDNLSLDDYFYQFVLNNQQQMTETELAKQLGISRKCLWERRQRYGIPRQK